MDEETLKKLIEEIREIKERLAAIEKEQRMMHEDILSGNPRERMHRRLLNTKSENIIEKNKTIDDDIKIEI
ncbi:MAG: hypothetical protein MUO82_00910 [Candidatus Thermoplasmatota archaeon]|nr:hypothetical protein [Candidatus Thermoplasmatota archaeon]